VDLHTQAEAASRLAKQNGLAIDEHCDLENRVVKFDLEANVRVRGGFVNQKL
jgi:hypothetical protein